MAKQKRSGQTWWPLYVLALIMVGLLFLAHRLAPSPGWRTFLDVGIVMVDYGLIVWWLETHPNVSLNRPSAGANSQAESPELEIPPALASRGRIYFYVHNDPALIYGEPEQPNSSLRLNGHHVAKTASSLPEEAAE
jgi:hypothetical protein